MGFNKELFDKQGEFAAYLISEKWKDLKLQRFKKDNYNCVLCKSKDNLVCHHLTYRRLYRENIDDLVTLCKTCHSRFHKLCPPKDIPSYAKQDALNKAFAPTPEEMKKAFDAIWEHDE